MKRYYVGLIIFFFFIFNSCSPPDTYVTPFAGSYGGKLLYMQGLDQTLGLLDIQGGGIYPNITATESAPNHLALINQKVYVTNSLSGTLQIFDYSSAGGLNNLKRVFLGENKNPWMVVPQNPEGISQKAYIPCYLSGEVLVYNLSKNELEPKGIPVGNNPQYGAIQGTTLYVGNVNFNPQTFKYSQATLTLINTLTDEVIKTITLTGAYNPQALISLPSLGELHIVCTGNQGDNDGKVLVLDTTSDIVTHEIDLGGSPSWSEGGEGETESLIYLSGVGGIQAYNYQTLEIQGEETSKGWYVFQDAPGQEELWSGAYYSQDNHMLYIARSNKNRLVELSQVGSKWELSRQWDTLGMPQGNFLILP